jgi:hypothetical protein
MTQLDEKYPGYGFASIWDTAPKPTMPHWMPWAMSGAQKDIFEEILCAQRAPRLKAPGREAAADYLRKKAMSSWA